MTEPELRSESVKRYAKPQMMRDVIGPSVVAWGLLFLVMLGVGIWRGDDGRMILARALVVASTIAFVLEFWLLTVYNRSRVQVCTTREYYDEPRQGKRGPVMIRLNGEPDNGAGHTWRVGSYHWTLHEQRELARRLFNDRGEWTGHTEAHDPNKFIQATIVGIIKSYTKNFPIIRDDFKDWDWIDDDQDWTRTGKNGVRESLWFG